MISCTQYQKGYTIQQILKGSFYNNTGMEDGCKAPAYYQEADFSF